MPALNVMPGAAAAAVLSAEVEDSSGIGASAATALDHMASWQAESCSIGPYTANQAWFSQHYINIAS